MSGTWERTFEVAAPVERVWAAFADPAEQAKLFGRPDDAPELDVVDSSSGLTVLEAVDGKLLRWSQERPDLPEPRAEFTVVFESTDHGSRIHVTRCGFGEGDDADIFNEATSLGWLHGVMDLIAYVETGQLLKRHYDGCVPASTGMVYRESDAGLRVQRVAPGTFAADAGLEPGDLLVRLAGAAVFRRSDVWLVNGVVAPGTEVEVEYVRGGERRTGSARLSPVSARLLGE
jgi:uncharacterized protein YndB with AHSA1/START domain